jgi:Amt family ammonium transporter
MADLLLRADRPHGLGPGGYLGGAGVLDFAGGTVVHINSAIAGLVAAIVIGKRKGYGTVQMAPHNLALTMVGGSLLWVGWFGFNVGSVLSAGASTGITMINTHLATAAALVSWTLLEWIVKGKPSLLGAISGAIAGLVAITPACGFVSVNGAFIIGLAAVIVCYWGVTGFKHMFGYDDALDVWGVHGVGGLLGIILLGVFASTTVNPAGAKGLIHGSGAFFGKQVAAGIGCSVYAFLFTYVMLKAIDLITPVRVTEAHEQGLDEAMHGETAYSI